MTPIPLLKLSTPPEFKSDDNLFAKFCPSPKGRMIADFQNAALTVINSGYPGSDGQIFPVPTKASSFLQTLVDPTEKIKALIASGKIIRFEGNCPLDQAEIFILDDTNHTDTAQDQLRGEIANAVKGKENIYLREGYGSDKIFFSRDEIQLAFPANLEHDNEASLFSGWDEPYTHKLGLESLKFHFASGEAERLDSFLEQVTARPSSQEPEKGFANVEKSAALLDEVAKEADPLKKIDDAYQNLEALQERANARNSGATEKTKALLRQAMEMRSTIRAQQDLAHKAHIRTTVLLDSVSKFKPLYPAWKIILFGGAGHLHQQWLLERLNQLYRFCILTPAPVTELPCDKAQRREVFRKYYADNSCT